MMKKPFLKLKPSILYGTGLLTLVLSLGYSYEVKDNIEKKEVQIKVLETELDKKEKQLKEVSRVTETIKAYIQDMNPDINEKMAEKYAKLIIKESEKRGTSPYIQAVLLKSESSFKRDPKHSIDGVVGMGGIYWDVWKKELKKEGIAYSKEDLRNASTNIKASAYILSCYMDECNAVPIRALTKYKGTSDLGRNQARLVLNEAIKLKAKTSKA